jgi:DNA modification methylase
MWQILEGDCVEQLKQVPDACVDALVTDPPYGLSRDLEPDELADVLRGWIDGEAVRVDGRGFMGKAWDSFVPGPHVWRAILRTLKPGAHLAVFAGSRTFDLMSLSLRLAGAQNRDTIMLAGWLYGSGFPKSLNFDGGRGTALKPAFEPILLCRKPLDGTIAHTLTRHGTGTLNIDACRVDVAGDKLVRPAVRRDDNAVLGRGLGVGTQVEPEGRWPANLVLVHSPACATSCAPECPTLAIDAQSKSASRYFSQFYYEAKASRRERELGCEALPARTGAEAVEREPDSAGVRNPRAGAGRTAAEVRNWHPTVKPLSIMRWLVRLCAPEGGVVLDPFAGSGSTLAAAVLEGRHALGVELGEGEAAIARARVAYWEREGSSERGEQAA